MAQPNARVELLVLRLKATAMLQMQMAAALTGKGQDELQAHFVSSSKLLIEAARELMK
jgi:hypothetical protein